jgi:hypothetical protein
MYDSIGELGYKFNKEFLAEAPQGTVFYFNTERAGWEKRGDDWYSLNSGGGMTGGFDTWHEARWNINRITIPAGSTGRSRAQERKILENVERLMQVCTETIEDGHTPDPGDVFWMDKLLTAFELGENLKGWNDK